VWPSYDAGSVGQAGGRTNRTSNLGVLSGLDLVKEVESVLDELGERGELSRRQRNGPSAGEVDRLGIWDLPPTSSPALLPPLGAFSLGCLAGRDGRLWASAAFGAAAA